MKNTFDAHEALKEVTLTVNGKDVSRRIPVRMLLSDFLRGELALTGTHVGCEQGHCGCCTVLVDGKAARSCLMLAVQATHCAIVTIESLAKANAPLHPIQQAFIDNHAFQCGFCTPGIVMGLFEHVLQGNGEAMSDAEIRRLLAGHLCRCTGYQPMVDAVRQILSLFQEPQK
ncbi:(2Fe-2S)-binding protein [Serratia sp. NA_112.1]|uniref:(2Fe-2S)-binding protein n=1 Tax=Serratia sp. NA_112.1 TaxID=3415665 RepID=UPI0040469B2C